MPYFLKVVSFRYWNFKYLELVIQEDQHPMQCFCFHIVRYMVKVPFSSIINYAWIGWMFLMESGRPQRSMTRGRFGNFCKDLKPGKANWWKMLSCVVRPDWNFMTKKGWLISISFVISSLRRSGNFAWIFIGYVDEDWDTSYTWPHLFLALLRLEAIGFLKFRMDAL